MCASQQLLRSGAAPAEVPALICAFTRFPSSWVISGSTEPLPKCPPVRAGVLLPADAFSSPIPLSLPAAVSEHSRGSQCTPLSTEPCSGRTASRWLRAGETSVLQ